MKEEKKVQVKEGKDQNTSLEDTYVSVPQHHLASKYSKTLVMNNKITNTYLKVLSSEDLFSHINNEMH